MRKTLIREETEDIIRKFMAFNYGSVSLVDHAIGEVLASLDKLGLSDNTMVIFTSDHGDYMGDHSMLLKGPSPYIGTLHVPLIWKVPGLTKIGITDSLISSVDIPGTILDILKIKKRYRPPRMQGYDMTPVLKDTREKVRDKVLVVEDEEVGPKGPLYTRLTHLITEDYKLTTYAELPGYGDIYNRNIDKEELNNLWEKDKDLRLELLDKLLHEYMITRSRFPIRQGGT
jgi:arylsulfatase A-like enzyme